MPYKVDEIYAIEKENSFEKKLFSLVPLSFIIRSYITIWKDWLKSVQIRVVVLCL